jgi:hypothetical protein
MTLHNFIVEKSILMKGRIRRTGDLLALSYGDRDLRFVRTEWAAYPINEIFIREVYSSLKVRNRNVVDIGASIADSPIYFILRGARHVYAYEPDKERYDMARRNIALNNMNGKITLYNKPYDGRVPANAVLKMDCEGCEYELIRSELKLGRFREVVLEYHSGPSRIKEALSKAGFSIEVSPESDALGMIYASKAGRKPKSGPKRGSHT